jgi:hypothetical protein
MKKNNILSLLKGEKIPRNWGRIVFYAGLLLFGVFLITSASVITYSTLTYDTEVTTTPTTIYTETANKLGFNIPIWSVGGISASFVGLISIFTGNYLGGTLILDNKKWLLNWRRIGKAKYKFYSKTARINTSKGDILVSKEGGKYKLMLPLIDEDLTKYGLVKLGEYYIGYSTKAELSSILHVYLTQIN